MNIIAAICIYFLSITTGAGCNMDKGGEAYTLSNINVSKTALNLKVGETELLKAAPVPAVANQLSFQWGSADNTIAMVSNGLVKAIKAGTTTITVSYRDVQKTIPVTVTDLEVPEKEAVLYQKILNNSSSIPEMILNGVAQYNAEGLNVTGKNNIVKLDKFYALAERRVQYKVKFSADAKAIFRSSEGDFNAYVDVPNKRISIATNPAKEIAVNFLQANREYLVEVYHIYQESKLRIVDVLSGQMAEVAAINDGQGGAGQGVLQPGFGVGMQWDYYCFGLTGGTSMLVKQVVVYALKKKVKLLMYGDSITQPEAYFPTKDFPQAWTQQVINRLGGDAMSSGRGGAQIDMVANYIKNELPFIKAKYVMVTIGTNGGNTEAKLTQLVNYIKSQGAIPILNNIPSNESGTQVTESLLIEQVRNKSAIKGIRFDLATSLVGDGKQVDKATMYWEDYTGSYGWQIYHHPNEKGGKKMFDQTLIDMPEIYQ